MPLYPEILFWLWGDQSLLLLLIAACGEAAEASFNVFGMTRPGIEPTTLRTRGKHANTTEAVKDIYIYLYTWKNKW